MSADELTREAALEYLERDGGRVPCSRYGSDSSDCAPVAWRVCEIVADANGDPIDHEALDYAMGLVVNDHDDVAYLLATYGDDDERAEWAEWAEVDA